MSTWSRGCGPVPAGTCGSCRSRWARCTSPRATPTWDRPEVDRGLLALQAGVVVRDKFADRFLDVHEALFALRHDEGRHLEDEARCAGC